MLAACCEAVLVWNRRSIGLASPSANRRNPRGTLRTVVEDYLLISPDYTLAERATEDVRKDGLELGTPACDRAQGSCIAASAFSS